MSNRLQDKVSIITGAASGIGKGCANVLAAEGATIAICDINPNVTTVGRAITSEHDVPVEAVITDVRSSTEVARFVENTIAQFGKIDILINNAGIWRATPITDSYEKVLDDFEAIVTTNLKGVFQVGRSVIPHMVEAGSGEIINIATDHIVPPHGFATGGGSRMDVYDASKWGTRGLTESWAKALKPHKIRVNALGMDATDSAMVRYASGQEPSPEILERWMKPEQIGELAVELILEGPEGRTGEHIGIWLDHEICLPDRKEELPSRHP